MLAAIKNGQTVDKLPRRHSLHSECVQLSGHPKEQVKQVDQVKGQPDDLVEVGYVVDAYGIHGLVKIHSYSSHADVLLKVKQWWLKLPEQSALRRRVSQLNSPTWQAVSIARSRRHTDVLLAQMIGVLDRTAAEALVGRTVWVSRAAFPALPENEYYWVDLIGLRAVNLEGEDLGCVAGLLENNAHPVLRLHTKVLKPDGAEAVQERLVPFVARYVHQVDLVARYIQLDWGVDY